MALERSKAAQPEGRRWFGNDYFDLIVWSDASETIKGFQLCYDKGRRERALTWHRGRGFSHDLIDPGDNSPFKDEAPTLEPGGHFPRAQILSVLEERSVGIDPEVRGFVLSMLRDLPER